MFIAILAFLFVTGLFVCLASCAADAVRGRQKIWVLLLVFAGWAAIVAYATNLVGLWGKTFDPTDCMPDWIMIPFCVVVFTLPITFPLLMGIREIWREGGENSDCAPLSFAEETSVGVLYVVSLGLSFYLTDRFGIHYWWSFPISLPLLLVLFLTIAGFVGSICWLTTQLARRFSPASKRSKKLTVRRSK